MEADQEDEKKLKKMLSWSDSSDDEQDGELKAIKADVITNRRALKVVDEPQFLSRKVDSHRINAKFLRVYLHSLHNLFS